MVLISPSNRQRSISLPPGIDIGVNSTPIPVSSDMFLLICNILPDSKMGFANPVLLTNKAISEIVSGDKWKELKNIAVVVISGGQMQDAHS